MTAVTATLVRSMGDAAGASSRLVEQCVDYAVAQLQQAEAQASGEARQRIAEAWRELQVRRDSWVRQLPQRLATAFEREAAGLPQAGPARPDDEPSLALVDDTEIARTIEAARLAQQLATLLERPLAELDALMSTALGLPGVQPERNPLRPAVYAQALRDLMAEDRPQPAWPALWMRHMAAPLALALEQVYRDQARFLTVQRVNAASYRLRASNSGPSPLGRASGPAPLGAPSGPAPLGGASGHAPLGGAEDPLPWQNMEPRRLQQFLVRGEPQAQRPLSRDYYAQAEAELRRLERHADEGPRYDARAVREQMHLPPVDRPARPVGTDSPLPSEVWGRWGAARERALVRGRLKTQAREIGQVYGLEVVRRLVDRVADDPRLLGPVREAIVGLEPSLLRLAMVAPRFFSDQQHPGRLLVEGVAQRSFKYNDEFSVEFQGFFGPVVNAFQRLNAIDPLESAEPFRTALATLQAGWAAQDALDEEQQRKVLEAVQFAERRHQEAERIASELRLRPDLEGVAEPVRDFLLGPWALVVAQARLTQPAGGIDPGGHLAVVSELLWSVKRELTLHEPARAFALIPRVLLHLRAGLAMLGQPPQESEAFFHQLEALHRPVMKLRAKKRHGEIAPVEPPPPPPAAPLPAGQPWMAAEELHAAGFEDKAASDFAPLAPPGRPAAAPAPGLEEGEAAQILDRLEPGAWVDLYARQQWRRARLTWASQKRSLFMFVSHGGQPHSMTRRSLERLVRGRLLRPVDAGAVVPRALARLAPGQPAA